jgi:hypothetical protein
MVWKFLVAAFVRPARLPGVLARVLPYSFRAQSFTGRANMEESKAP